MPYSSINSTSTSNTQLTKKITIPRFGKSQATESLNVSMAAGIILGEIFSVRK